MPSLLVSLCNLSTPAASGMVRVDVDGDNVVQQLVNIGAQDGVVHGCTGIAQDGDCIYCGWIGDDSRSYVSVLDPTTLIPLEVAPLDGVLDLHSLTLADDWLYVVSTGTDEVKRIAATRPATKPETVWQASPTLTDTHHLNSIAVVEGRLLCTAFGPKKGERWSTALDGYVLDIESGETLYRGIEHPHSVTPGPDDIYVAESRRTRVRGLCSGRLVDVDGYARGVAFTPDETLVVGVSRGRNRRLGTLENAADPGDPSGEAGLVFASTDGTTSAEQVRRRVDLSGFGPEVYDVLVMP